MKKSNGSVLLCILALLLCGGCQAPDGRAEALPPAQTPSPSISEPAADTGEEPGWAAATQIRGAYYSNLNLDGVGGHDDEMYVSIYRWENADLYHLSCATVLRLRLGTGETLSAVIPVAGLISVSFGELFSAGKDAIVLEIDVPNSNYGAANVFVYDIHSAGDGEGCPEIIKRLDTYADPVSFWGNDISGVLTTGTEIVELGGTETRGLRLPYVGPYGKFQMESATFYWDDSGYEWSPVKE